MYFRDVSAVVPSRKDKDAKKDKPKKDKKASKKSGLKSDDEDEAVPIAATTAALDDSADAERRRLEVSNSYSFFFLKFIFSYNVYVLLFVS